MIVVVTGPSASGKTTGCRRHAPAGMIPEYTPTGARREDHARPGGQPAVPEGVQGRAEPDSADIPAQAGRLAEPLREWYQAWETVSPGCTRWSLPPDGVPSPPPPRPDRGDPAVLDGLVEALPRLD